MTLRRRLLATSLATLVAGLGALLVIGNVLLDVREHSEASSLLRARVEAQVAALVVSAAGVRVRETPNDAVLDHGAWVFSGTRLIERPTDAGTALDRAAVALGRRGVAAEKNGPGESRLRAEPVRAPSGGPVRGAVVVALATAPLEHLRHLVLIGSLVLAALLVLAGAVVILGALNGALQPVAEMTASARDWGAHDLDRRFALGPARDELTELAATLDELLGRIAASRRHEQRFASEVAHELRTPLAGLRARAELALSADGPDASAEHVAALTAIVERTQRLDGAIDTLVALARNDLDAAAGTVDVAALAAEIEDVTIEAPPALPPAEGDADVVRRALAPLLDNARRHAREHVTVTLGAAAGEVQITVRDDGPGLPDPAAAEALFSPGARGDGSGADGAGLGLALARRLARSCGGDVRAGEGPGGCFVLSLPVAPGHTSPR